MFVKKLMPLIVSNIPLFIHCLPHSDTPSLSLSFPTFPFVALLSFSLSSLFSVFSLFQCFGISILRKITKQEKAYRNPFLNKMHLSCTTALSWSPILCLFSHLSQTTQWYTLLKKLVSGHCTNCFTQYLLNYVPYQLLSVGFYKFTLVYRKCSPYFISTVFDSVIYTLNFIICSPLASTIHFFSE